jgi:predicted regulator of Ras-like GTPase activity (Roadblock/LC7/MglB family)
MEFTKVIDNQPIMLSEDLYQKISEIIAELSGNIRSDLVVFCETNGYPVTHLGKVDGLDLSATASLAANNFSATAEMAKMLGEDDSFRYIFNEGKQRNIYISNVGFNFILLVIFNKDVALGMVRIYTKKAIEALNDLLKKAAVAEEQSKSFVDLEFKTLLDEELNKALRF